MIQNGFLLKWDVIHLEDKIILILFYMTSHVICSPHVSTQASNLVCDDDLREFLPCQHIQLVLCRKYLGKIFHITFKILILSHILSINLTLVSDYSVFSLS